MERIPAPGELYRYSSDKVYQVVTAAMHAESKEQMIVYQAMFGDFSVSVLPLSRFESLFQKMETKHQNLQKSEPEKSPKQDDNLIKKENSGYENSGYENPGNEKQGNKNLKNKNLENENTGLRENSGQIEIPRQDASLTAKEHTDPQKSPGPGETAEQKSSSGQEEYPRHIQALARRQMIKLSGERPHVQRPAESKRAFSQTAETAEEGVYSEKRRRQIEEREQRRGLFRKPQRHDTATEELQANPCLLKFLEADTYEDKFHVLNQIQDEITDRLIDDMAVVLDVVIPEGPLLNRYHQLKDVILTRQKYETTRFR